MGNKTDHGGKVIEAVTDLKHVRIAVSLDEHLTACAKCGPPSSRSLIRMTARTQATTGAKKAAI